MGSTYMLYRFRCWEQHDEDNLPSLVASCKQTGRVGFFDTFGETTFDITSVAATRFEIDGEPIISVGLRSQSSRTALYCPLRELADEIAEAQEDQLWRMLMLLSRQFAPEYRLA